MLPEQVTIDADGRYPSGRGFRALADEYAQFTEGLRSRRGMRHRCRARSSPAPTGS